MNYRGFPSAPFWPILLAALLPQLSCDLPNPLQDETEASNPAPTASGSHRAAANDVVVTVSPKGKAQAPIARCRDVTVDANADSCAVAVSINDGSLSPVGRPVTHVQSPAGPYTAGQTLVTLRVTDSAGLSNECTATVTVVDGTAPYFVSVPADIVASPPCTPEISLVRPSTADNCGGSVRVASDAPTTFPMGVTNVTWTLLDGAGNTTTYLQKVTLLPAVEIDGEHTITQVKNNACLKLKRDPVGASAMDTIFVQPQSSGVDFPISFTWSNCNSTGSGSLSAPWQPSLVKPVSASCPTLIKLGGTGESSVSLTWWGNS